MLNVLGAILPREKLRERREREGAKGVQLWDISSSLNSLRGSQTMIHEMNSG